MDASDGAAAARTPEVAAAETQWDAVATTTSLRQTAASEPLRLRSVPYGLLLTAVNRGAVRNADDITGLRLWDFSTCLARFVAVHHATFDGKNVLELGCGCGSLSLSVACSATGATVVATDYSDAALGFARRNVELHRERVVAREVRVEPLAWTTTASSRGDTAGEDGAASGRVLAAARHETCDFVFGCDLLYYKTSAHAVLATAARLLAAGGVFVFGGRARERGTIATIRAAAETSRLVLRFVDMNYLRTHEEPPECYWLRTEEDGSYFALLAHCVGAIDRFVADIGGALRFGDAVDDDSEGILDNVW